MSSFTTGILFDERFLEHDDPTHFENARRLQAINALLDQSGIRRELTALVGRPATEREIRAVHTPRLIEELQFLAYEGGGSLDPDTYLTGDSWAAACCAAGGVIRAVEAVIRGEVDNAFALVRPPGHHATPNRSMGFCLINNVAIAAQYALDVLGLNRVAIVDWDTHHGNGTQDIFYAEKRVLYCSTHTWPLFPGTGFWREMGTGAGMGTTLNVPLPYYLNDDGYNRVYDDLIVPAVRRFRPEIILVSAGLSARWKGATICKHWLQACSRRCECCKAGPTSSRIRLAHVPVPRRTSTQLSTTCFGRIRFSPSSIGSPLSHLRCCGHAERLLTGEALGLNGCWKESGLPCFVCACRAGRLRQQ